MCARRGELKNGCVLDRGFVQRQTQINCCSPDDVVQRVKTPRSQAFPVQLPAGYPSGGSVLSAVPTFGPTLDWDIPHGVDFNDALDEIMAASDAVA